MSAGTAPDRRIEWRALLARTLLFAFLFWILAEGVPRHAWLAAAFAVAAAATSIALLPVGSFRLRAAGALRFVPWFLGESVRGGLDVASRAIRRGPPLRPGFVDYPLRLSDAAARAFFANAVSLLPGTLSIELGEDVLRIHALDTGQPIAQRLERLEDRVDRLFA